MDGRSTSSGQSGQPRDLELHWQANRQALSSTCWPRRAPAIWAVPWRCLPARDALDTFGKAYLAMGFGLMEPEHGRGWMRCFRHHQRGHRQRHRRALGGGAGRLLRDEHRHPLHRHRAGRAGAAGPGQRAGPQRRALADGRPRRDGHWETTQENAWAIIGSHRLDGRHRRTGGRLRLAGGRQRRAAGRGQRGLANNIDETTKLQIEVAELLADEANRVVIERWAPEGRGGGDRAAVLCSMYLRYFQAGGGGDSPQPGHHRQPPIHGWSTATRRRRPARR